MALALAVFAALFGGWAISNWRAEVAEAHGPLPGGGTGADAGCAVWFVGSSTIVRWPDLDKTMAPWSVHNRGVNRALIAQIVPRLGVEPAGPPPRAIVFYGGDNDIAHGRTVDQTVADIRGLIATKRRKFGAVPLLLIGVKPTPSRWVDRPQQRDVNSRLNRLSVGAPDISFLDVTRFLLVDGRPGPFYVADGIHLSPAGYARIDASVATALKQMLPASLGPYCARHPHEG